jgi:hypothetical protein
VSLSRCMWAAVVQLGLTVTQPLVLFQHGPKDCKACGVSTTLVVREKGKAWVEARDLAVNTGEEMQARLGQRTHA